MKTFDPNLSIRVLPSYNNSDKYYNIDLESGDYDYIERWLKAKDRLMKVVERKIKIKKIYGR